jgi:hypothetical protein
MGERMNDPVPRQDSAPSKWCWYVLAGETREIRKQRLQESPEPIRQIVAGMVIVNYHRIAGRQADAT